MKKWLMLLIKKEVDNLYDKDNTDDMDQCIMERIRIFVKLLMLDTKGCVTCEV